MQALVELVLLESKLVVECLEGSQHAREGVRRQVSGTSGKSYRGRGDGSQTYFIYFHLAARDPNDNETHQCDNVRLTSRNGVHLWLLWPLSVGRGLIDKCKAT